MSRWFMAIMVAVGLVVLWTVAMADRLATQSGQVRGLSAPPISPMRLKDAAAALARNDMARVETICGEILNHFPTHPKGS